MNYNNEHGRILAQLRLDKGGRIFAFELVALEGGFFLFQRWSANNIDKYHGYTTAAYGIDHEFVNKIRVVCEQDDMDPEPILQAYYGALAGLR